MSTKNLFQLIFITIFITGISACNSQKKQSKSSVLQSDNSKISLDWNGTYRGILPCADCPGIKTQLVLNSDMTYKLKTSYLERGTGIEEEGKFSWNKNGNIITLDGYGHQKYLVGENRLFSLDGDGNKITGDLANRFILTKKQPELTGKDWKLIILNGKTVSTSLKEPFIMFQKEELKVTGNTGCNNFFGTYELSDQCGIKFSQMGMTKMACIGDNPELKFMNALAETTNYSLTINELILKDKSGKLLAKFEDDYFLE